MSYASEIQKYGAVPANIQWTIVRGDTGTLRFDFYEDDEKTVKDTTGWTYLATAYDSSGNVLDDLPTSSGAGYVVITAPASTTANWGTGFGYVVGELPFDIQVTIPGTPDTIWTPVLGTIRVLGDVTTGGSL